MRKMLASLMCLAMLAIVGTTAFAADYYNPPGLPVPPTSTTTVQDSTTDVSAMLSTDALTFNITVPTSLTIDVGSDGTVTVANNLEIVNNALAPIVVQSVAVHGEGWDIVDHETDFKKVKVNSKEFGMVMNGNEVAADGTVNVSSGFGVINGKECLPLDYDITLALQSQATEVSIATVEFVFDWDTADTNEAALTPVTDEAPDVTGNSPTIE